MALQRRMSRGAVALLLVAAGGLLAGCHTCKISATTPLSARYLDEGMKALATDRPEEAIKKLALALSLEDDLVSAKAHLGYAQLQLGRLDAAEQTLRQSIDDFCPDYPESYHYLALVYEERRDIDRALATYQEGIEVLPGLPDPYYNRARLLERLKRDAEALRDFDAAARLGGPLAAAAHTAASRIRVRNGLYEEAEKGFTIATDLSDAIPEAQVGLAELYEKKQGWVTAIVFAHEALRAEESAWTRKGDRAFAEQLLHRIEATCAKEHRWVAAKLLERASEKLAEWEALSEARRAERRELAFAELRRLLGSTVAIDPGQVEAYVLLSRLHLDEADAGPTLGWKTPQVDAAIQAGGVQAKKAIDRDAEHEHPDAWYQMGRVYAVRALHRRATKQAGADKDLEVAERLLRDVRLRAPGVRRYHRLLGRVYFEQAELRKAEREWRAALASEGTDAEKKEVFGLLEALGRTPTIQKANALNDDGVRLLSEGRLDDARKRFAQAVHYDPGFAIAFSNLGLVALEQGNLAEAEVQLTAALQRDPDLHFAHIVLGRVRLSQKRFDDARAAFVTAGRLQPGDPAPLYYRAVVAEQTGRIDEAKDLIQRATAIAPEHYPAQTLLAKIYVAEKLYGQAETLLQLAMEHSGERYMPALLGMAELLFLQGRHADAERVVAKAGRLDDSAPEPLELQGRIIEARNEPKAAAVAYAAAAERFVLRGRLDEAEQALASAVRLSPNDVALSRRHAQVLAMRGRFGEAIARHPKAAAATDPESAFSLGTIYEEMAKLDLAADSYRQVVAVMRVPPAADKAWLYWQPRYRLARLHRPGTNHPVTREEARKALHEALDVVRAPEHRREVEALLDRLERER